MSPSIIKPPASPPPETPAPPPPPAPADHKCSCRIEPILYLLFAGMIIFTGLLILVNWLWPQDGQMFQAIFGLSSGFGGAFLLRVKGDGSGTGSNKT